MSMENIIERLHDVNENIIETLQWKYNGNVACQWKYNRNVANVNGKYNRNVARCQWKYNRNVAQCQ